MKRRIVRAAGNTKKIEKLNARKTRKAGEFAGKIAALKEQHQAAQQSIEKALKEQHKAAK
jgi:hypothetical protein